MFASTCAMKTESLYLVERTCTTVQHMLCTSTVLHVENVEPELAWIDGTFACVPDSNLLEIC